MKTTSLPWMPIDTCPKVEEETYLGYDGNTAKLYGDPTAGLCLITWWPEEDDIPAGWHIQPFTEGLDYVYDENTIVEMWCPLSALLPPTVLS